MNNTKIIVLSEDDSDEDCRRTTFYTRVDGKRYDLACCVLGDGYREITQRVKTLFGEGIEVEYA